MSELKAKTIIGSVISAARDKSITVMVERKTRHPKYNKYIKRTTKLHAHDENNVCENGDKVSIKECRPVSKSKSWMLVEVIK